MPSYAPIISADADENVSVTASAGELTLPAYFTATSGRVNHGRAILTVRTARILYTENGTAPTAADESTGTPADIGDQLIIPSKTGMTNFKARRATGTDGAFFVRYQKRID